MARLIEKSKKLTGYLEFLINNIADDNIRIITPKDPAQRGCQLSIQLKNSDKGLHTKLEAQGVICDWREPDVIRVAPVPLYNSFEDVFKFSEILKQLLQHGY